MDISQNLKTLGLQQSEIRIYLYIMENGVSTPPQIAKGTGIARTNCYNVVESLKAKELIVEQELGKRRAYLARDPEALFRSLEEKKEVVRQILPDLRALYTIQKNKPKIRFYEGFEQVKEIYHQSLSAKKILAIGSTQELSTIDAEFFTEYFTSLQKKGIVLDDILTHDSRDASTFGETILKGFYSVRLLPQDAPKIFTDILIWDNNIALITLRDPIFGTLLTNPLLAETFRTLHGLIWDSRQG